MKKLRPIALILILILLLGMAPSAAFADNAPELRSARSVLVGDAESGRILYSVGAFDRTEPASITKVMTLLLAVEAIERGEVSLEDTVEASENCWSGLDDTSSSCKIYSGEKMSLNDLLYCAALNSANEACNIIAEYLCGSIEDFVKKMNDRAGELGCTGTHFVNPHGMPASEHYTTARDLFVIACEAKKHELFRTLCSTAQYTTAATNASGERNLNSSNALINEKAPYGDHYLYEGADGIKTGHTDAAGYCLLSSAERDGVRLIAVVMGAEGDGVKGEYFDSFEDTISVLDWAFDFFGYRSLAAKGESAGTQKVTVDGRNGTLKLKTMSDCSALLPRELELSTLKREITLTEGAESCPEGKELGTLSFYLEDGTLIASVPLTADGPVELEPLPTPTPPPGLSQTRLNAIYVVCGILLVIAAAVIATLSAKRKKSGNRKAGGRP